MIVSVSCFFFWGGGLEFPKLEGSWCGDFFEGVKKVWKKLWKNKHGNGKNKNQPWMKMYLLSNLVIFPAHHLTTFKARNPLFAKVRKSSMLLGSWCKPEIRETHQLSLIVEIYHDFQGVLYYPRWLLGISEASTVSCFSWISHGSIHFSLINWTFFWDG